MLMDGIKPEEATLDQVMAAIDKIEEANDAGQIRRFTGNDYTTDLTKGNVVIAMAYAADLIQLKADNADLDFAVPEEGAVRWSDNMMIPAKAEHPYGAEVVRDQLPGHRVEDARVVAQLAGGYVAEDVVGEERLVGVEEHLRVATVEVEGDRAVVLDDHRVDVLGEVLQGRGEFRVVEDPVGEGRVARGDGRAVGPAHVAAEVVAEDGGVRAGDLVAASERRADSPRPSGRRGGSSRHSGVSSAR